MYLQSIIQAIYPSQCVACDTPTEEDFGLCGSCWRETHFIGGTICDKCGTPLAGDDPDEVLFCDDCMTIARPWDQGRAVFGYSDVGRKLVLSLKHGDRTDLSIPISRWLYRAATPLLTKDTVLVPVPLHWTRLLRRRYNQAAILARSFAQLSGHKAVPDALLRPRKTAPLKGHTRNARFAAMSDAILPNPRLKPLLIGKPVLIIDDVMTSGATLAAATEACISAGAAKVNVLTLARSVKDT